MMEHEILLLFGTSLGTVYRALYTDDINTTKKFIVSLMFSGFLGLALIYFIEENNLKRWLSLIISVLIGLTSSNLASLIIKTGQKSEGKIADAVSDLIKDKLLGQSKSENKIKSD